MPLSAVAMHGLYDGMLGIKRALSATRGNVAGTDTEADEIANRLRQDGFVAIPPRGTDNMNGQIRERLDSLFEDGTRCIDTLGDAGLIRLRDSAVSVPEIVRYVLEDPIASIVHRYVGTGFGVVSSDIYRTFALDNRGAGFDSEEYHFDNGPPSQLKGDGVSDGCDAGDRCRYAGA